jgi:hypothetical protein
VIRKYFSSTQELHRRPTSLILVLLFLRNLAFSLLRKRHRKISIRQFSYANNLPAGSDPTPDITYPGIDILFVSTAKDFSVLPDSILAAVDATAHHSDVNVVVIVPDKELLLAREVLVGLVNGIEIQAESEYLTLEQFTGIQNRFKKRAGWVIQQILKVEYVSRSSSPGVLIVDSDTILLSQREWLTDDFRQILSPSWEWHEPYYAFLTQLGFEQKRLQHSFISHHMLMQPKYMREARAFVSWEKTDVMVNDLIANANPVESSPFCIEYELYAQYMLINHPEKVNIVKWSNIGTPRSGLEIHSQVDLMRKELKDKFASVSLHAYL